MVAVLWEVAVPQLALIFDQRSTFIRPKLGALAGT